MSNHEEIALRRASPGAVRVSIPASPGGEDRDGSDAHKKENEKKNSKKRSGVGLFCERLRKICQTFEPGGRYLRIWNTIFLWSWLIGIATDPLLFYVPFINEERKCVAADNKLKIVALVCRSVTDVIYITHFVFHVRTKIQIDKIFSEAAGAKIGWLSRIVFRWLHIVFDVLAVLPLPQVVTLSEMSGLTSSNTKKVLSSLVLLQYLPKLVRIYQSCEKLKSNPSVVAVWVMGLLQLFLYFTASHVIGAFWYFFAVQRQRDCWDYACQNQSGCVASTFECSDAELRNVTFLNEFCPINPPNATVFDFGIFADALQYGMLSSTGFPRKFLHCFWWGLRNLSSLGQSLQTRSSAWEAYFSAVVCIIGLILLMYLLGNLECYSPGAIMRSQMLTRNAEEEIAFWIAQRQNHQTRKFQTDSLRNTYLKLASLDKKLPKKMRARDVEMWLLINEIPKKMWAMIVYYVQSNLHGKDVNLENLLPVLPEEYRDSIKKCLCLDALNNVAVFRKLDEKGLKVIYDYLKPVVYKENSYIMREGEPLEFMLFVTHGTVWTFETNIKSESERRQNISIKPLHKGELYGEEVVHWSMRFESYSNYPVSTKTLKSQTKVEAFVLMATDMKIVVSKLWTLFRRLPRSTESNVTLCTLAAASVIQETWRSHQRKKVKIR